MNSDTHSQPETLQQPAADGSARARLPRQVREQQMIDAATVIFSRHGYYSASMDQIAEEVGISKPMLYAYFDSKERLYSECVQLAGNEVIEAVNASFDPNNGPEKTLWNGFFAYFEFVRANPAKWQLVRNEALSDVNPFKEVTAQTHQQLRAVIEELSRVTSKETVGDPFADPELRRAAAFAMYGAATAMANRWLDSDCTTTPAEFSTQLMNFFWLGFNDLAEGSVWSLESSPPVTDSSPGI